VIEYLFTQHGSPTWWPCVPSSRFGARLNVQDVMLSC